MELFQIVSRATSGKMAYDSAGRGAFIPERFRNVDGEWGILITKPIGVIKKNPDGTPLLVDDKVVPVLDENGKQVTEPREELSFVGGFREAAKAKNMGAIALKAEMVVVEQEAEKFAADIENIAVKA